MIGPENAKSDVMHVDKDRDLAEQRIGDSSGWQELAEHLFHLMKNMALMLAQS